MIHFSFLTTAIPYYKKQKREKKCFWKVFDALNKASPYLHIVTTSNLKVNLLDGKMYKLKPLGNESAVKLLQLITPVMTVNDCRTINELLDGIPLALKIVGSLVNKIRPPNLIIKELQQNSKSNFRNGRGKVAIKLRMRIGFSKYSNLEVMNMIYCGLFVV